MARISGYAVSTVSRVINRKGYSSPKAKAEIEAVIKQLDYVPSALARDLNAGSSRTIGLIMPDANSDYFTALISAIVSEAQTSQYHLTVLPSAYDVDQETKFLEQLRRKVYDGLIFLSHALSFEALAKYTNYGPIVVAEPTPIATIQSVYSSRISGYEQTFSWLQQQNISKVVCLQTRKPEFSSTSLATMNAYKKVYGHQISKQLVFDNIATYQDAYNAAAQLKTDQTKFEAILANGDDEVAGLRQYYFDHALQMPLIVSQGTSYLGRTLNLPRIDHHVDSIGKTAFALAVCKLKYSEPIVVDSDFIKPNAIF